MEEPLIKYPVLYVVPNHEIRKLVVQGFIDDGYEGSFKNSTAEDNNYKYHIKVLNTLEESLSYIQGCQYLHCIFHEECLLKGSAINYILYRCRFSKEHFKWIDKKH